VTFIDSLFVLLLNHHKARAFQNFARTTNASAGNVVLAKPSGLENGEVMVAHVAMRQDSGDWMAPAGWTAYYDEQTAVQDEKS
jgi:hypothetical protein